jgi:hypothetical protein
MIKSKASMKKKPLPLSDKARLPYLRPPKIFFKKSPWPLVFSPRLINI